MLEYKEQETPTLGSGTPTNHESEAKKADMVAEVIIVVAVVIVAAVVLIGKLF